MGRTPKNKGSIGLRKVSGEPEKDSVKKISEDKSMDLPKFSIKRVETALNTRCWDVVFNNDNARDSDREAIKRSSKNRRTGGAGGTI